MELFSLAGNLLLTSLLGYAIRKFRVVDAHFGDSLSRLLTEVIIPCYILQAILEIDNLPQLLGDGSSAIIAAAVMLLMLFFVGTLANRLTGGGLGRILRFGTMFSNALVFGMPVAEMYWGPRGLFYLMAFYFPIRFAYYGLSELLLSPKPLKKGQGQWRHGLRTLYSPATLSCVAGLLLVFFEIRLPEPLTGLFASVGSCCKPLGMMLIGIIVGEYTIRKIFSLQNLLMTLYKIVLLPLLALALVWLLGVGGMAGRMVVLYAALPCGPLLATFCIQYDSNTRSGIDSAGLVLFSTIGAVVTVPVWLQLIELVLPA